MTFNTNDPTADEVAPAPFVGQNFTNYGQVWAREVMRAMPDGGTLAITNCCPGHFALEERIRSFTETLEAEGEGKYEILETIITGADESEIFAAIEAFYAANPDVNMITGVDYYSNIIAQFIKNNNLKGRCWRVAPISLRLRSTVCARATLLSGSARIPISRVSTRS